MMGAAAERDMSYNFHDNINFYAKRTINIIKNQYSSGISLKTQDNLKSYLMGVNIFPEEIWHIFPGRY